MLASKVAIRLVGNALEQQQQNFLLLAVNGQQCTSRRFLTPLIVYKKKIDEKQLMPDKAQKATSHQLEDLYNTLKDYTPKPVKAKSRGAGGIFGNFLRKEKPNTSSIQLLNTTSPKGLYIYGSVGGGKTTLMDLFYDCCTHVSHCF